MIAQTKYNGTSFGEPNVVQPDVAEPRYIDPHLVPSIAFETEASDRNGGPLEGKSDKAEIAALTAQVRDAIDEKGRAAGRKLRNRIILINAVAWIVIAVVVRLIFF
jgi:hypothetical protein